MSTLLFADAEGTPYISSRRTRPLDRLACRLSARRLDAELALGASPDGTAALCLHAHTLIGMRMRCGLARSLRRALQDAHVSDRRYGAAVPVCRAGLLRCRSLVEELALRLSEPGPVSARAVAQTRLLITDGSSPLYGWRDDGALDRALQSAIDALAVADA